jgi:short-subunit dehydrogenase
MNHFENKVSWLTGASSGIGEALAKELARQKAKLVLSSRREAELQRVKNECAKYIPAENILVLPIDVASVSNTEAEVKKVMRHFGKIDLLINNAGIAQRSLVFNTPAEVERKIMEVNYWGAVKLTKAVLPEMRSAKGGSIAIISSVLGKFGMPGCSSYAASKHALLGYFESLRFEEARNNIRVHIICPGYVRTNVSFNAINERGEAHGKMDAGQNAGMTPEAAAKKTLAAIARGEHEYFFGGKEIFAVRLKKYFPKLFYKIILKRKK